MADHADLAQRARSIVADYDPHVLARAINYLYTKETMSSYEIEREVPNALRAERFISLLRTAANRGDLDKNALLADREKLSPEQITAAGIQFCQDEQFFIRPKPETAEDTVKV